MNPDTENFKEIREEPKELSPITKEEHAPGHRKGWGDGGYSHTPREIHQELVNSISDVSSSAKFVIETGKLASDPARVTNSEGYRAGFNFPVYVPKSDVEPVKDAVKSFVEDMKFGTIIYMEVSHMKELFASTESKADDSIVVDDVTGKDVVKHAVHGYAPRLHVFDSPNEFSEYSDEEREIATDIAFFQRKAVPEFMGEEDWSMIDIQIDIEAVHPYYG